MAIATTPLKKVTFLFLSNPPLKVEVLSSLTPLFENLVGGSTSPAERGISGGIKEIACRIHAISFIPLEIPYPQPPPPLFGFSFWNSPLIILISFNGQIKWQFIFFIPTHEVSPAVAGKRLLNIICARWQMNLNKLQNRFYRLYI